MASVTCNAEEGSTRRDGADLWALRLGDELLDLWDLYAEGARDDAWWFLSGQRVAVRPWRGKPIPIPQKPPPPFDADSSSLSASSLYRPWNPSMLRQNPPPDGYFYIPVDRVQRELALIDVTTGRADCWELDLLANGWRVERIEVSAHQHIAIVEKCAPIKPQIDSRTATERFMGSKKRGKHDYGYDDYLDD